MFTGGSEYWESRGIGSSASLDSGLSRRETFVSTDINRENYSTEDAYLSALNEIARLERQNSKYKPLFEATIDSEYYRYGISYNVGDLCTIQDDNGKSTDVRVTEFTIGIESDEISMYPSFEYIQDSVK